MERFLIEWSARGAYMTEPVDGWIRGAGERCLELGDEVITGELPLGQAAIEYEVGYLAVVLVPRILAHVKRVLGQDTLDQPSRTASPAPRTRWACSTRRPERGVNREATRRGQLLLLRPHAAASRSKTPRG
jgi:hypothetical protein